MENYRTITTKGQRMDARYATLREKFGVSRTAPAERFTLRMCRVIYARRRTCQARLPSLSRSEDAQPETLGCRRFEPRRPERLT